MLAGTIPNSNEAPNGKAMPSRHAVCLHGYRIRLGGGLSARLVLRDGAYALLRMRLIDVRAY